MILGMVGDSRYFVSVQVSAMSRILRADGASSLQSHLIRREPAFILIILIIKL